MRYDKRGKSALLRNYESRSEEEGASSLLLVLYKHQIRGDGCLSFKNAAKSSGVVSWELYHGTHRLESIIGNILYTLVVRRHLALGRS